MANRPGTLVPPSPLPAYAYSPTFCPTRALRQNRVTGVPFALTEANLPKTTPLAAINYHSLPFERRSWRAGERRMSSRDDLGTIAHANETRFDRSIDRSIGSTNEKTGNPEENGKREWKTLEFTRTLYKVPIDAECVVVRETERERERERESE